MKPSSAKAKGRAFQQAIQNRILAHFPKLEKDDVRSTSMGAQGEDVPLSPAARRVLPIQIEAKHHARIAVYEWYEQAKSHGEYEPVVILRQNHSKPLVLVDLEYFLALHESKQ